MFNTTLYPVSSQENLQNVSSGDVLTRDRIIKRIAASTA
jgi:hypothetical protein